MLIIKDPESGAWFNDADTEGKDATIASLTAELAEARAERDALIGVAYEAARASVKSHSEIARKKMGEAYDLGGDHSLVKGWSAVIAHLDLEEDAIRSLTPTDATANVDRIKAEAELAGWKRGRDDAAGVADSLYYPDETKISASIRNAILALTPPADLAARLGGAE